MRPVWLRPAEQGLRQRRPQQVEPRHAWVDGVVRCKRRRGAPPGLCPGCCAAPAAGAGGHRGPAHQLALDTRRPLGQLVGSGGRPGSLGQRPHQHPEVLPPILGTSKPLWRS